MSGHKLYYHLEKLLEWQQGGDAAPVYAEIGPTSLCNHRCLMCGYEHLGHKNQSLEYGRLMTLVAELHQAGLKSIVFAGDGEPLLNKATVPSIQKAASLDIDCALSTNGLFLNKETTSLFAEALKWIRFSINGGNRKAYGCVHRTSEDVFDMVIANLAEMAKLKKQRGNNITIGVQCVLLPENVDSIPELAAIVKESGADYFIVKPFYPVEKISYKPGRICSKDIESLRLKLDDMASDDFSADIRTGELKSNSGKRTYTKCYGINFIAIIASNGDVYSCLPHIGDERFKFGNLHENSFLEIWHGERKKSVMEFIDSIDKNSCQPNCRNHRINEFLWDLKHPHSHWNFI